MKIAFVNTDMNVGGIPKASIPLLQELVKRHDVTLILTNGKGEIINEIPSCVSVKVLPSENYTTQLKSAIKKNRIFQVIKNLFEYKKARNWIESLYVRIKLNPKIKESFDLAIGYFGMNAKCVLTTLECINARRYVAFMHGDHPFKPEELSTMEGIYRRFDRIFSVSETTRQKFIRDYPGCALIADVFYNIMDVEQIKRKANEVIQIETFNDKSKLHIVTVGRVSPEKGQMMIPDIAQKLKTTEIDFNWHIVGTGNDFEMLSEIVRERNLSDHVILHGNALNPYPYIKAADIYVQPSYTEGYCLTIIEAAILGRPIVATKVGGTWEHFDNYKNIVLCEANPKSLYEGIQRLAKDSELRTHLSSEVVRRDWSNISEIDKLEKY